MKISIDWLRDFIDCQLPAAELENLLRRAGLEVAAIHQRGVAIDKVVVAEGIETADQAWMLKMMGCQIGQGYYFGRPRTGAEMLAWFADHGAETRPMSA